MIDRRITKTVEDALSRQAAVGLIGPRQVGKTTLALQIAEARDALYLDLENPRDRNKLKDPMLFLVEHEDQLVILDEIHRVPELFQPLRSLIDQGRRKGKRYGRFLILGSAAIDLLRQSGETLAGRIEYVNMGPLDVLEIEPGWEAISRLWIRGGFPEIYLSANERNSFRARRSFIRTYLERDVPQFGPRIPAETLERLWIMLAHSQGSLLNASRLAESLMVSSPTVSRYIDLLVDLLLVRRLTPYHGRNTRKRLVRSPKVYVRDSGLVHALLNIEDSLALAGHPVVGSSWEGFVVETLIGAMPEAGQASFYRTAGGSEMDLVLELGGNHGLWAIEIKYGSAPKLSKGFHEARDVLAPKRTFIVYSGEDRYPIAEGVEVIGLREMAEELVALNTQ